MKKVFKPYWFARIFPFGKYVVTISDDTVCIQSSKGIRQHTISKLKLRPQLNQVYFFNAFSLDDEIIWGLPRKSAKALVREVSQKWYLSKYKDVINFIDEFGEKFVQHYARASEIPELVNAAEEIKSRYHALPEKGLLPSEQLMAFEFIDDLIFDAMGALKEYRLRFIKSETVKYKELFDRIESNPLTERQREACVIDDDNNLVLAGAGTGKTSTMVGKAGYLVESGRTKPSELLLLAFGNEAAGELQERILKKLKNPEIKASTFHSLGKSIIAQVEGRSPTVSELATDGAKCRKFVDQCFNAFLEDQEYEKKAIQYFDRYLFPDLNPFDFKTEGEYLDYLESNEIRSLKGDEVKSYGELLIANFLYLNGVEYEYERPYEKRTFTESFQQYRPDFYLSKYEIYLEYYGIDRNGNTAPYVDKNRYNLDINWKRQLHKTHNTQCIECFHFEKVEGSLVASLKEKLLLKGVEFSPIPDDSVMEELRDLGKISAFSGLLSDLLTNVKSCCQSIDEALSITKSAPHSEQATAAMELLLPILKAYEQRLQDANEIDFNDMIQRATRYVIDGKFKPEWKYILVDEFQDISSSRARLVLALRDRLPGCSLFCVGDDWQSIYRFAGSDLSYTTRFNNLIGPHSVTTLDKTYRFNNSICDVASRFVTQNPIQVKKELHTHSVVERPAVSVLRCRNSCLPGHLDEVMNAIAIATKAPATVFIVSRYKYTFSSEEFKEKIRFLAYQYPNLSISPISMHASKGKEADFVIVIGLEKGKYGFPSEKITHPLLNLFLPKEESYSFAEERRLFYVAITRAKHGVYIVADMEKPSIFMAEIIQDKKYDVRLDEFGTSLEQEKFSSISCPDCKTGALTLKENRQNGSYFVACSHYSRCRYTGSSCSKCSGLMAPEGRFNVCIKCGWKVPKCQKCSGEMKRRPGGFWGCSNYKGKDETPTCTHTEKSIQF